MKTMSICGTVVLLATLCMASPLPAQSTGSVVTDAIGDAYLHQAVGSPAQKASDYLDLTRARVDLVGGIFILSVDVAGSIPENPAMSRHMESVGWNVNIDTIPNAYPAGDPLPPGFSTAAEFLVTVRSEGSQFAGVLIDRRPLLAGREAVETSLPIDIDDGRFTVFLSEALIGDPAEFLWSSNSFVQYDRRSGMNVVLVDLAPDVGSASWPANNSSTNPGRKHKR